MPVINFIPTNRASWQRRNGACLHEKTKSKLVTKYAQHLDFLPDMVKLLKVPDGYEVKVAASGLGRPRMMYTGPNGRLYITIGVMLAMF